METNQTPSTRPVRCWFGLDIEVMFQALFLPVFLWFFVVILVSLDGYPGVICMTPLAWLLGLSVGNRCMAQSRSTGTRPLVEAVIAGAVLGLLEGVAVILSSLITSAIPPQDRTAVALAGGVLGVLGIVISGGMAALSGWLRLRRKAEPRRDDNSHE